MYKLYYKVIIDRVVALFLIILFFPLMVIVALILLIINKQQVFFVQQRPGKDEKLFYLFKFKTMNDEKDSNGAFLPDASRLTPLGKLLRKTSLDELPQFFNVLLGHMSFIGPRPLLIEYLPLYNVNQKKRHNVKPGITGWAQVHGRNAISWPQKFEYDIWYVQNVSFKTDMKILWLTVKTVFAQKNISHIGNATMEKFIGGVHEKG